MNRRMYCIYDFKSEAPVNSLFQCFSSDAEATRMFARVVGTPGQLINDHPGDFGLMYVGDVNFDNLSFVGNPTARGIPIITGDACVRAAERARAANAGIDFDNLKDTR